MPKSSRNLVWMDLEMSGLHRRPRYRHPPARKRFRKHGRMEHKAPQPERSRGPLPPFTILPQGRRTGNAPIHQAFYRKNKEPPLRKFHHAGQAFFVQVHARNFGMALLQEYRREFHQGTLLPLVPEPRRFSKRKATRSFKRYPRKHRRTCLL